MADVVLRVHFISLHRPATQILLSVVYQITSPKPASVGGKGKRQNLLNVDCLSDSVGELGE